ncbi:MAG: type II secretion system F family protein [Lachnospiraceae bacterium]|nr:type II secretion system F family protein [Lachnospiraceae bacterium]
MIRIAILAFVLVIGLLIYLLTDHSKEAKVERARAQAQYKRTIHRKIIYPVNEFIITHVPEEKAKKVEGKYRQAGFNIPYSVNILLCGGSCLLLAFLATTVLNNIFMGIVMLCTGWIFPSMFIEFLINKRIKKLDTQIGMFMRMVTERYQSSNSFYRAFNSTIEEFEGEEPLYSELVTAADELATGEPMSEVLKGLAKRTSNKYMDRFADYYAQTVIIGTENATSKVLTMAVEQYEKHMETDKKNARELSEISMQSYVMLGMVPGVAVFGATQVEDYIAFMTTTMMGKIGSAIIVGAWILIFWAVTFKLTAPLE